MYFSSNQVAHTSKHLILATWSCGAKHVDKHGVKHGDKHGVKHVDKHGVKHCDMHGVKHVDKHGVKHVEYCPGKNGKQF